MSERALILLAHGSRDSRWRRPFEHTAEKLKKALGPLKVYLAYLEQSPPTLEEVTQLCYERGFRHVIVLPLFMSGGGHVDKDIPKIIEKINLRFRDVQLELREAIAEHPGVATAIVEAAAESYRRNA